MSIAKTLSPLVAAYPNHPFKSETAALYDRMLQDIPDDVLKASVIEHIAESTYFPSVADLRSRAAEIKEDLPSGEDEWIGVGNYLRRNGAGRPHNEITSVVVESLGGYPGLADSDNPSADRAQFIRLYNSLRDKAIRQQVRPPELEALIKGIREAEVKMLEPAGG
jgi:hypothetical protein